MEKAENTPAFGQTYDQLLQDEKSSEVGNIESKSAKYAPNYAHISVFMVIVFLSGASQGYGLSVSNQLSDTFNEKYNWHTTREKDLH